MFRPEFSHLQALSLHKNKLQMHINLRALRVRSHNTHIFLVSTKS